MLSSASTSITNAIRGRERGSIKIRSNNGIVLPITKLYLRIFGIIKKRIECKEELDMQQDIDGSDT